MSEINDTEAITEGGFSITLKLIEQYQRKYPSLLDKYKYDAYHKVLFVEELIYILTL